MVCGQRRQLRRGRQDGQAAVELVALTPLIVVAVLLVLQVAAVGWTYWSAGASARVAARTAHVGGDVGEAARGAMPGVLRGSTRVVEPGGGGSGVVRVGARPPTILPVHWVWTVPRVWARSGFGGSGGSGS